MRKKGEEAEARRIRVFLESRGMSPSRHAHLAQSERVKALARAFDAEASG